jgi:HK97 family phage major capsid protein
MNIYIRELEIDATRADRKQRRVPAVLSTTYPVPRDGFREVLLHGPENVDLSRAPLPLIESHDGKRLNIGIVENLRLAGDRLRGDIVFGNSARANELWPDVEAGIIRNLSVGYTIANHRVRGDTIEATRWQPHETSLVSIPADPNAGTYRSMTMNELNEGQSAADAGENLTRSQRRALNSPSPADLAQSAERERIGAISTAADQLAKYAGVRDVAAECIRSGASMEQFRARALECVSTKPLMFAATPNMAGGSERVYSLSRALRAMIDPRSVDAGYEREVSDELARQLGRKARGFFMPMGALNQRTLSVAGAPALVGVEQMGSAFIDILRARSVVMNLSPMILSGLTANISIPRLTASATAGWIAGDGSDSLTNATPTFDAVTLSPKTVGALVLLSRKMVLQSNPAAEGTILADLAQVIAVEIDKAAINGTGLSDAPTGILHTSGIATNTFAAAAPTFAEIVAMESALLTNNADASRAAYITTPTLAGSLKTTPISQYGSQMIWQAGVDPGFGQVNGLRAAATSNVPAGKVILGNWSDFIMGMWGGVDIELNPYEDFAKGVISIRAFASVDFGVRHAPSFAAYSTP